MTTQISVESLSPITYNQIPVITTELLAQLYETKIKNISDNFLNNTTRFVAGKHYFKIEKNELREFKNRPETIGLVGKNACSLILWTERGAARHAKMLETDQAWEVFEKLEDCYFSHKENQAVTAPDFIPRRYLLTLVNNAWFVEPVEAGSFIATPQSLVSRIQEESYLFDQRSVKRIIEACLRMI